jgi:hypothetical protein
MATDCSQQLTFWELGAQQLTVDCAGGCLVTDAGRLPRRLLDKQLGVLTTIAQRLPDPRNQKLWTHTHEALLTQEVYHIRAGYPDGHDAQQLRNDPLFQTLVDGSPDDQQPFLSFCHGYLAQHPYLPLLVFDGQTGFPLAAWLRLGTVPARCGVVTTLRRLVAALRAAWPDVLLLVRGDSGLAVPEGYAFCESHGLLYALGYSSKDVRKERTAAALSDLECYYPFYRHREEHVQRFEVIEASQAASWSRPRRIVAKIGINRHGVNRRFVVTHLCGDGQGISHGFYVQRDAVAEKPIGALKKGLGMDRLSFPRFRVKGLKLLAHTLAYALVVLHWEAVAAVPEVAKAEGGTLRQKLWKVGAVVKTSVRRLWFPFSETWPHRHVFVAVYPAACGFVAPLRGEEAGVLPEAVFLPLK